MFFFLPLCWYARVNIAINKKRSVCYRTARVCFNRKDVSACVFFSNISFISPLYGAPLTLGAFFVGDVIHTESPLPFHFVFFKEGHIKKEEEKKKHGGIPLRIPVCVTSRLVNIYFFKFILKNKFIGKIERVKVFYRHLIVNGFFFCYQDCIFLQRELFFISCVFRTGISNVVGNI